MAGSIKHGNTDQGSVPRQGSETHGEPNDRARLSESTPLIQNNRPDARLSKSVHYMNIDSTTRFWFLFCSLVFGNTIAFFDSTLMASAHPVITSYFNASNAAAWLSTVFYLTSTVAQPLYGRMSDTVGRRPVFLFSITVFMLTTVWCALAQNIGSFIAARAFCGLGAGGVTSMAFVITSDIVKIEYRGIYQSYINLSYGFGNGMGAALGGILCDSLGWRWAFLIQLPFILVFLVLAAFSCPADLGPNLAKSQNMSLVDSLRTFDTLGGLFLTITITALILFLNLGGTILPWTHPIVIVSGVIFLISVIILVPTERRASRPILPIPLLASGPVALLIWSNFLSSIVTNTILFNIPLYLQGVKLTTAATSGLYLTAPLIGLTISSLFAGFYITYTRRLKPMLILGALCILLGIIFVTFFLNPSNPTWLTALIIPWASIGQGFAFPTTTIAVLALNPQSEQAVVTTTLGLLRNLGAIMGVALSSYLFQNLLKMALEFEFGFMNKDHAEQERVKKIIEKVIRSVKAVKEVVRDGDRAKVQGCYWMALKGTFGVVAVAAVVVLALIVPARVGTLKAEKQRQSETQDGGGEEEG